MAGAEQHMQNEMGLRGDVFVWESSCKHETCLLFATISLHLMISECDRQITVNLMKMKCITMCERNSLIIFPVTVMSLGLGEEKWALLISGREERKEKGK